MLKIVATPTGTPMPMAILSDVLKPLDNVCAVTVGEGVADVLGLGLGLVLVLVAAADRCT